MGERIEFIVQQNITASGRSSAENIMRAPSLISVSPRPFYPLTANMQDTDQRKQPPGGRFINLNFIFQGIDQYLRALIV